MLTLKREAACYEVAQQDPALSRLMPRLVRYDENPARLIVELADRMRKVSPIIMPAKGRSPDIGQVLGEGLGLYHTSAGALIENKELQALFARQMPVILTAGERRPRCSWAVRPHRPSHLCAPSAAQGIPEPARRAGRGMAFRQSDPRRHEVGQCTGLPGGAVGSTSALWIGRWPISAMRPGTLVLCCRVSSRCGSSRCRSRAVCRLKPISAWPRSRLRPCGPCWSAFWEAYARTRGFAEQQRKCELERCMRFAAARLVWAAVEQRLYTPHLDPAALRCCR